MRAIGLALAGALAVSGCAGGLGGLMPRGAAPPAAPEAPALTAPEPVAVAPLPRPAAATPAALDTTTAAERAAAAAPQAGGARLGTTIASLGDPAAPGFWLETPLVSAKTQGRVRVASGAEAAVELRPSGGAPGAGSRISLPAMRLLGLSLTDLPELTVFGG
ncbi:hypothetical protein LPB142_05900 [Rhodobacter xanthinilyticus]|uniref:D-galactarate dehydratase n=1 Tax=Rhodobacter xanthinilyticus TaxID=1850250 RepID=A0A1D9MAT6_9RHOB|nr:hypothetical protein [Rhodobacter xanthinilyticus]AOZ68908.1 hypothetical protein LPB142_05900 [Rhodobacter xanthinilyticus]